ncbi:MAG: MnhB domain-containing protein [Legionellales bacterium]|jgi:hypothetical protein|nr:MnhB domain-containing protein [Legionellales bacterium]
MTKLYVPQAQIATILQDGAVEFNADSSYMSYLGIQSDPGKQLKNAAETISKQLSYIDGKDPKKINDIIQHAIPNISTDKAHDISTKIIDINKTYIDISQDDFNEYENLFHSFETNTKVKAALENYVATVLSKVREEDDGELANIEEQLRTIEQALAAKAAPELSNVLYYGMPLAQSGPTLGLIGAAMAGAAVFLGPVAVLMYALVYTYNNIHRDSYDTKTNKFLIAFSLLALGLTGAGIAFFVGASLPFGGILIIPLAVIMNFSLFIYSSRLEYYQDKEATSLLTAKLGSLQSALNDLHQAEQPNNKKIALVEKSIKVLLCEYTNLVSTIKAPWTKKRHTNNISKFKLDNIVNKISNNGFNRDITNKVISPQESDHGSRSNVDKLLNYNLEVVNKKNEVYFNNLCKNLFIINLINMPDSDEKKLIRNKIENTSFENKTFDHITTEINFDKEKVNIIKEKAKEIKSAIEKDPVLNSIQNARNHINCYASRDIVYYIFNVVLITIAITAALTPILAIGNILITPVMIGIAAAIAAFTLITVLQWALNKAHISDAHSNLSNVQLNSFSKAFGNGVVMVASFITNILFVWPTKAVMSILNFSQKSLSSLGSITMEGIKNITSSDLSSKDNKYKEIETTENTDTNKQEENQHKP